MKDLIVLEYNTKDIELIDKIKKENSKEIWSFQEEEEVTDLLRRNYPEFENNFVTTNLEKKILLLENHFDRVYLHNNIKEERFNKVLEVIYFYLKENGYLYITRKINETLFLYKRKEQEYYLYQKR